MGKIGSPSTALPLKDSMRPGLSRSSNRLDKVILWMSASMMRTFLPAWAILLPSIVVKLDLPVPSLALVTRIVA